MNAADVFDCRGKQWFLHMKKVSVVTAAASVDPTLFRHVVQRVLGVWNYFGFSFVRELFAAKTPTRKLREGHYNPNLRTHQVNPIALTTAAVWHGILD